MLGFHINAGYQTAIQHIINDLSLGKDPDKPKEMAKLAKAAIPGKLNKIKTVKIDLFLESTSGELYLVDLKTVKPNISNFKDFKRTLLEWAAIALTANPDTKVNTLVAIPYNPYEPEPYQRWTMKGMLDLKYELRVADEFWNFVGGEGAYEDLLDCFERAGIELREEIDQYFLRFRT